MAATTPLATPSAAEPPSVKVELWNKNDGTMGLTIDKKSVAAGPVEFEIRNTSTDLMHEFLIAPWPGSLTSLPYDATALKVKEDQVPGLQGQEDMKPGTETTLRLVLRPGSYIAFCNQPGHYKTNMYTRFTVTR
ncbi:MAG TPA: hypothetical protein VGS13_01160 [Stellaceae bacterium]|nr:hypothetical protein [Stellaceae bacterium]